MPSNTPSVEEGAALEDSSHDVPPLPIQVIERNRLTEMEIRALPRFKDYTPGTPSKVGHELRGGEEGRDWGASRLLDGSVLLIL